MSPDDGGYAQLVGEAFTGVLLRCAEKDFSDTTLLGIRLLEELARYGLVVTRATDNPGGGGS